MLLSIAVPAHAAGQVTVTAEGVVEESCSVSLPTASQQNLGTLTTIAPRVIDVNVSCNTPWTYSLVSTKFALTPAAPPPTPVAGAFASSVPYTVTTSFGADGGDFGDVDLASASLTTANAAGCVANAASGCNFNDSGSGVSINETGTLTLTWSLPTDPLLAATYTDTLTLTVLVL